MGISNTTRDEGLAYVAANGDTLVICSADPANFAAVAGVTLGTKTGVAFGAPEAGTGSGRKIVLGTQTGGTVSADGTADFWAITNGTDELYATGDITNQVVTNGNTFSTTAPIEIQFD